MDKRERGSISQTNQSIDPSADCTKEFEINTDASRLACGGVLMQKHDGEDKVVAYMSEIFGSTKKISRHRIELSSCDFANEKFRRYVEGTRFKVFTDHRNLKDPTGRLAGWSLRLQAYNFVLVRRKGKLHVVPDALSRAIAMINSSKLANSNDKWYNELREKLIINPQDNDNPKLRDGVLYLRHAPKRDSKNDEGSWNTNTIMNATHLVTGRFKTTAKIRSSYFWPKMNAKYVRNCEVCKATIYTVQ